MRKGAFYCFTKPVDQADLVKAVGRATKTYSAFVTDPMIGHCELMLKVKRQVSRVALLDTNIFVHGDSGTSKKLVAKSIHSQPKRSILK
ncbi:MAG TPA: hypothetical protein DEF72_04540 [Gammaproteobacteria bacterium]|nr:hypothetical protein [Gammaproteobacteria bacterium]HBX26684.1 hypothetical protein [Gammaproteobacteria bacterium]|tara:strand:+ start:2463 stop:2729 length:267 start_codon:yes stop_codon:yes gene_type:complete